MFPSVPVPPLTRPLSGSYGAKRHILWLRICAFCRHTWSEHDHSYVARTSSLWSWFLQHRRSEWTSSRVKPGSLRKRLLQCQIRPPVAAPVPSGVRIDLTGTRCCILPSQSFSRDTSCSTVPGLPGAGIGPYSIGSLYLLKRRNIGEAIVSIVDVGCEE